MNIENDYSNFIEYEITETRWVPLSRKLTEEEKELLEDGYMYDLPNDLILWGQEEVQDIDNGSIRLFGDNEFTEWA